MSERRLVANRIDYHCDRCKRVRCLEFDKLPNVPDVRKVILPPDWAWIEEGLYCEKCKGKVAGAEDGGAEG